MPGKHEDISNKCQLYGWLLFVICSFFFIADSVASGSPLGITGSVLFLLGCIVFLIPFFIKKS